MDSSRVLEFAVGRVLGRSLSVLRRNARGFGLLAVIFALPTVVFSDGAAARLFGPAVMSGRISAQAISTAQIVILGVAAGLAFIVLQAVAAGILSYGTVRDLRWHRAGLAECLRGSLPALFPVIGIAVLATVLLFVAMAVAALPGAAVMSGGAGTVGTSLMVLGVVVAGGTIYTALWLSVPIAVVEGSGAVASLKRSAAMTKGYRWRVFGLVVVLVGLNIGADWLASFVKGVADMSLLAWPAIVLDVLIAAFFLAWEAVAAAVAYHDLRILREGHDGDDMVRVFE